MVAWRPSLSVVCLQVLCMASKWSPNGATDLVFIVHANIINDDLISESPGVDLTIGCGYTELVTNVNLYAVDGSRKFPESLTTEQQFNFKYSYRTYVEKGQDAHGCKMYSCSGVISRIDFAVNLTINFSGCTTDHPTSQPTAPTTSTSTTSGPTDTTSYTTAGPTVTITDITSYTTAGPTDGGNQSTFPGLKPLIFTVASVFLLGTLAIVAIITCWIRARRSFNSRIIRPHNTPQDYLDYINDNEFTPLTTSEFLASLQERPPTYNQSEEMSQECHTITIPPTGTATLTLSEGGGRGGRGGGGQGGEGERQRIGERQSRRGGGEGGGGRSEGGESEVSSGSVLSGGEMRERLVERQERTQLDDDSHALDTCDDNSSPHQRRRSLATGEWGRGDREEDGRMSGQVEDAILVDLELPNEASGGDSDNFFIPTQEQIEVIEARVNTLEFLQTLPALPLDNIVK